MRDKGSQAGDVRGRDSLTERAAETTAAEMVSGPEETQPVGAGTAAKAAGGRDGVKRGGSM